MKNLILASKSKYRKAQLRAIGLNFRVKAPGVDEDEYKSKIRSPKKLAQTLAKAKSLAVAQKHPKSVVIGSDQLVALGKEVLGKPGNFKNAFRQLKKMSGKNHQLITSVAVAHNGRIQDRTVVAHIKMRKLSDREIKSYLKLDKPYDSAGSYKFERAGLKLVQKMHVSDPSALIGLPLIALCDLLGKSKWP